ncbi:signal peptidase I [Nocardioides zhouii]|nr:signal peptidase I [Nocardioides zhouii]
MGGDAEQELRDLAATAYSQSATTPLLASIVLRRAQRQRRRRNAVRGSVVGAVVIGTAAAATIGGGPYYEYRQPSAVMEPTVPTASSVVVNRDLAPERLDVVQITLHIDGREVQGLLRVIGMAGDVVACPASSSTACTVTVNGEPVADATVAGLDTLPFDRVTVPEDALFVLGDARDKSVDSRDLGPVDLADVNGVVVAVINGAGKAGPVVGAPGHPVPDDYEIDPERPVPPAFTTDD